MNGLDLEKGCICPTCEQHCQEYRRIWTYKHTKVLVALGLLAQYDPNIIVHVNSERSRNIHENIRATLATSNSQGILGKWGVCNSYSKEEILFRRKTGNPFKLRYTAENAIGVPEAEVPDKVSGGYWAITQKGVDFAKGLVSIPSWIKTYNNKISDTSNEMITAEYRIGKDVPCSLTALENWLLS